MTLATIYKCSIAISAALMCDIVVAQAYHSKDIFYDLVRPNGRPRSDAVFNADLSFCYRQTGDSRYGLGDSPAFKQCMLGRKWQWQSSRIIRSPAKAQPSCFDAMSCSPGSTHLNGD
jgi:hypothetical protein